MGRQIVHRLLVWFPALLGVLFLCFCLLQVVPADPAMIIAGPEARAETIAAIYDRPPHPCTQALLSAIPRPDPRVRKKTHAVGGRRPQPVRPPPGCRFNTRCTFAQDRCRKEEPLLRDAGGGHRVACHFYERSRHR
jgi:oligopeptide/dipeptide ABC transporter ATP-binding protein